VDNLASVARMAEDNSTLGCRIGEERHNLGQTFDSRRRCLIDRRYLGIQNQTDWEPAGAGHSQEVDTADRT
jgi:hypothetical protein